MIRPQPRTIAGRRYRHHVLTHGRGDGAPIVLLHGFLGDLLTWQYSLVPLSKLGPVVAIDLPGHGGAAETRVGGLDAVASWLDDALEALGITDCHLVGHSFGGWVAVQSALAAPGRVLSLGLVACAGLGRDFNYPFLRDALAVSDAAAARRHAEALAGGPGPQAEALARRHLDLVAADGRLAALRDTLERLIAPLAETPLPATDWSSLRAPAVFLWSRDDAVVPQPPADRLPARADVRLCDGGGHVPHVTRPDWVNDALARRIRGVGTEAA